MSITSRQLSIGMTGQDVRTLQLELRLLGFVISDNEESFFGPATRETVLEFQRTSGLELSGIVNQVTKESIKIYLNKQQPKKFVVCGRVIADGYPVRGFLVQAFDIDLRRKDPLGYTPANGGGITTDDNGFYEVFYNSDQFYRAEKYSADLTLHVLNSDKKVLVRSQLKHNAPYVWMMPDLEVSANEIGMSTEYESITNEIRPLSQDIQIDGISQPTIIDKLADLKLNDIEFLAGETGIDQGKIQSLVMAAILQQQVLNQGFDLDAEVFYGLIRQGISLENNKLFQTTTSSCRKALIESIKVNLISQRLSDTLDSIVSQLERLISILALNTPSSGSQYSIGELLKLSPCDIEEQITFINLYINHEETMEEFWDNLHTHPDFQNDKVEIMQNLSQYALITLNHLPLIRQLQHEQKIKSPKDLVKLDISEWTRLIKKQVEGKVIGVPPEIPGSEFERKMTNYVNYMIRQLQFAFPTDAVAEILSKVKIIDIDNASRKRVLLFFANGHDFDLRKTNIDKYVADKKGTIFNGISDKEKSNVVNYVKRIQRIFQISSGPNAMVALLESRIHSAYDVSQIPRGRFIQEFSSKIGSEKETLKVYNRAQHITATTLNVYQKLYQELFDVHTRGTGL